jgi:hypothetical protein
VTAAPDAPTRTRRVTTAATAALVLLAALARAPAPAGAQAVAALRDYRWKQRVLVVFAPDAAAPAYQAQRAELARHAADLAARDVRVLFVLDAPPPGDTSAEPPARARALRRALGVPGAEFRAVLVGKDGGVKRRSRAPLTADALRATIDGMPMGRDEARRRGAADR